MCWSDDGRWLVWEEGGPSLASESGSLASYMGMILAYNDVEFHHADAGLGMGAVASFS